MDTESQVVWPLIGGLMVIVALIGLIEEDLLPGALRQWLMIGVVLLGFGLLLAWEIRRRVAAKDHSQPRMLPPGRLDQQHLWIDQSDRE
jgi:F0F1-type ATP synthase assembly protein I